METAGIVVVSVCVGVVLLVFCVAIVAAVLIGRAKRRRRQRRKVAGGSSSSSVHGYKHNVFDDSSNTKQGSRLMHGKKGSICSSASSPGIMGANRHNIGASPLTKLAEERNNMNTEGRSLFYEDISKDVLTPVGNPSSISTEMEWKNECNNHHERQATREQSNCRHVNPITLNMEAHLSESSNDMSDNLSISDSDVDTTSTRPIHSSKHSPVSISVNKSPVEQE